jgi:hypothetical protein
MTIGVSTRPVKYKISRRVLLSTWEIREAIQRY